jgi:hypothetical protein
VLVLVQKQKQDIGLAKLGNKEINMAYKRKSGKSKKKGSNGLTAKQMKLPKALRDKIIAAKKRGK